VYFLTFDDTPLRRPLISPNKSLETMKRLSLFLTVPAMALMLSFSTSAQTRKDTSTRSTNVVPRGTTQRLDSTGTKGIQNTIERESVSPVQTNPVTPVNPTNPTQPNSGTPGTPPPSVPAKP